MELENTLLVSVAVFAGGVVSGFAGFAFAAPAGAILAFAFPPGEAIPILFFCGFLNQATSIWVLRDKMRWTSSAPLLIGGALGLPIGLMMMTTVDVSSFRHGFGLLLIAYAAVMLVRPTRVPFAERAGVMASAAVGATGGFIGGFTAMPGAVPAVWLDMRGLAKEDKRGTLQPFIFGMQLFSLPIILATKSLSLNIWLLAAAIPALLLGTRTGVSLFGRMDERLFRQGLLALLIGSGLLLAMRSQ